MRALYRLLPQRLPGPGTGNYAFMPWQGLPAIQAGGPGTSYLRGMNAIQEPQVYVGQSQQIIGLEGATYGGAHSTGLIDMDKYLQSLYDAGAAQ